ncbi:hypothetical protein [Streptomyces sp. NPDC005476]|uniref:hypothetical protein n=1 Tax=Streptomyces sp. NPDC005476 TaxID=3156882 RepID=UPI0034522DB4
MRCRSGIVAAPNPTAGTKPVARTVPYLPGADAPEPTSTVAKSAALQCRTYSVAGRVTWLPDTVSYSALDPFTHRSIHCWARPCAMAGPMWAVRRPWNESAQKSVRYSPSSVRYS